MGKYGKSFTINGIFMVITILHETFSTIWEKLQFFSKKYGYENFSTIFSKKNRDIFFNFLTSFMVIYLPYFYMKEIYL